jgi:hypothetical protein
MPDAPLPVRVKPAVIIIPPRSVPVDPAVLARVRDGLKALP